MTNDELRSQIKLYLDGKLDLWTLCSWIYNQTQTIKASDDKDFIKLYTAPLHAQCLFNDNSITAFEAYDYIKAEYYRGAKTNG